MQTGKSAYCRKATIKPMSFRHEYQSGQPIFFASSAANEVRYAESLLHSAITICPDMGPKPVPVD